MQPRERDERWVYAVLVLLAVAYAAYRFRGSIDLSRVSFDWARRLGGTIPYALATVVGIAFQMWNRKRLERARSKLLKDLQGEGVLREEPNLKVAFTEGARGSLRADVHLTRAALYLFDRTGRREPMRFPLVAASARDGVVDGVTLSEGAGEAARAVQIQIRGPAPFRVEFETADARGWWTDVLRATGRSVPATAPWAAAEPEEARQE